MFSESIQSLINQSNAGSAKERVEHLESMIYQYTKSIQPPNIAGATAFSEYMKSGSQDGIKFKVVPPLSVPKAYIENITKETAAKYNLDNKLLLAIIKQESGFNSNAVSSAGAQGLMQLMPETARKLGVNNPFDPAQNVDAGARHIKGLLAKYRGNLVLALAAYNAGGAKVDKYGGVPPFKETQNYVKSILANYLS